MRKQTIWLIGIVLLIAFAGLLVMQFTYLSEIVSTREEQFDEAAKRALFGTMRQLERQETRKYLDEYYDDAEKQALSQLNQENSTSSVTTSGSISVQGPDGSVSTFKFQSNVGGDTLSQHHFEMQPRSNRNIQSRQRAMQDMLLGQYMYQRNLLDDVVFRLSARPTTSPSWSVLIWNSCDARWPKRCSRRDIIWITSSASLNAMARWLIVRPATRLKKQRRRVVICKCCSQGSRWLKTMAKHLRA